MSDDPNRSREQPGLSIAVPGTWMILDLECLEDEATVERLVDERIADGVIAEESRDQAAAIVARSMHEARAGGVRFAAVLVAEDDQGPVVASVTLTSAWLEVPELAELGVDPDADVEVVLRQPADGASADGGGAPTAGSAAIGTSSSTQVVLPAGPAVRIERVIGRPVTDTVSQEAYAVQYVVPVNHEGLTVTITGVSPALRLRAQLDEAFAEIADTLVIQRSFSV